MEAGRSVPLSRTPPGTVSQARQDGLALTVLGRLNADGLVAVVFEMAPIA